MFELYLSHTSAGEHSTDPRNQFHEVALREARFASDWRGGDATIAETRPSFVSRIRLAFGGGSGTTTDACSCPA